MIALRAYAALMQLFPVTATPLSVFETKRRYSVSLLPMRDL